MKKITRAGILSFTIVLSFMFTAMSVEGAAAGRFRSSIENDIAPIPVSAMERKHDNRDVSEDYLDVNKRDVTLKKGESVTLSASLKPSGKSVSVKWKSSNPQIAMVSVAGKVTAVSPGIAVIIAEYKEYYGIWDQIGFSSECYINVPGGAKDAKPLGISDRTYYYGKTKFTAPTSKYKEALADIKKIIGGYEYSGINDTAKLLIGSKYIDEAHTIITINGQKKSFGFDAMKNSPIKTSRGIGIGAKKSTVKEQYGSPMWAPFKTKIDGINYEIFCYGTKTAGKNFYKELFFYFSASKGTVLEITYFLGSK